MKKEKSRGNLPSIDVIKDLVGTCFTMCSKEVLGEPGDQMIFECALDKLM
jgi:hypothetical protein